jgi:uncharacterized protein YecE (DUF72 family)
MTIRIGTAGWALRKESADHFPGGGSHLERYSRRFNCVEVNSSFYRSHKKTTWERWSAAVPDDFRFTVKMPKEITHAKRLNDCAIEIERFLVEVNGLGEKLGALLVQLPPSLRWSESLAHEFFASLREHHDGLVACEPRHTSWFRPEATAQLNHFRIGRVVADPAIIPAAASPAACSQLTYFRWHGSPRIYYSAYDDLALCSLKMALCEAERSSYTVYCILDNTAAGAATRNALDLLRLVAVAGSG